MSNEKVFQLILRDYIKIKDHISQGCVDWRWFDMMDDIYGHWPTSIRREGGIDKANTHIHVGCKGYVSPGVNGC